MTAEHAVLNPRRIREVMSNFCTGVTVITALDEGKPIGFSCQSFASVSLDPPLVSFSPSRTSTTWPKIREIGTLAINVLAESQRTLCAAFAASGGYKFRGVRWEQGENGAPAILGALARVEATVETEYDAGDHTIVLARVTGLTTMKANGPLLFFQGTYGSFERM
ncbi:flavin reductase family protein [Rhodococcus sp. NPDC047139]|uniref:flavin reductase family protein n=1 Tax=Rhodococcus sp. NPDC047139 TaxID=3155141 RepID=UPI0033C6BCAF